MKFKVISKEDLDKAWKLHKRYVDEKAKLEEIRKIYSKFPKLFVCCYTKNKLIGVCIPGIFNGEIYIKGVAVEQKYWRKGIGSRLLKLFEQELRSLGRKKITVPVADINWGERFYLKNGYQPIQLLVKVRANKLPGDYREFKILSERREDNYRILYIKTGKYDPEQKEKSKKNI